jgi:hypothetical protein
MNNRIWLSIPMALGLILALIGFILGLITHKGNSE